MRNNPTGGKLAEYLNHPEDRVALRDILRLDHTQQLAGVRFGSTPPAATAKLWTDMTAQQSKDKVARILGILGLGVAVAGLYLSWRSFSWQKHVLKQNLEERLTNRVTMLRTIKDRKTFDLSSIGELRIEIVNMGQRTVHLRDVSVRAGQDKNLYAGKLVSNHDTPLILEPGINALYRVDKWDFEKDPLWWEKAPGEPFWISITTTRWRYEQEGQVRGFAESLVPNKISAIPAMP